MPKAKVGSCGGPHKEDPPTWLRDTVSGKGREIYQVDTWRCIKKNKGGGPCTETITQKKLVRDKNGKAC
jgi:hypothetical protein